MAMLGKQTGRMIEELGLPVIAAVNGFALGGGCELAMSCDYIIASENATFGQPEINLGIIPGNGGTQRLPRLIGLLRAKELVMLGGIIGAQKALEFGLVNRVIQPDEDLISEAKKIAHKLARKSKVALALAKAALNNGVNMDLGRALDYEIECFAQCFALEDHNEGLTAFLEKRKPIFKDR
jgi:enoyl-CoA hydratase